MSRIIGQHRWHWVWIYFLVVHPFGYAQDQIIDDELSAFDRDHWAYEPIQRPPLPATSDAGWSQNPIDRFILAELEDQSLRPTSEADKSTLLRRVCWDLTGLPPSLDQVNRYLADSHPDSYQRLVDSLMASPEYGKHLSQRWLDLARFAETDGFEHDKFRDQAWRYRDWVIRAMNQDFPYDEFVRWQLAGDQIAPDNDDAVLATAFCLSGPDMPDINSMDERRHVLLNEITSTVGSVLLSLQFGCAQCHDHKYDAISQADFYRLRSFFDSSIELVKNRSVNVLASYKEFPRTHLMERGDWRSKGPLVAPAFPRVLNASGQSLPDSVSPRRALAEWLTSPSHPLTARVIVNRIWQHHFGTGLSSTPSDFGVMGDSPSHPQLLDYLATELIQSDWSTKRIHRMIVSSNVYRTRSAPPADDGLRLDWQRAAEVDPENRLLSHFPRQRLDAEAIRDGLYAVSESINGEMEGPGVRPPLPPEMVKTLRTGQWTLTDDTTDYYRRSIYLFARRNLRYPFFATFDRPSADGPCSRRNESTTAVQSLTLLNSDIIMDAARRLATVVTASQADLGDQVNELYLRLYSRPADTAELQAATAFVQSDGIALSDLCRAMLNSNEFLYVD
ncbi:DUF1549 and DUF1553 domain-containing protein [Stieleria sp. TO1_6]|uniref:DUF1549 and DUF1553 domain-containing protein n=1 Tax=Stieleria tagensis TaxID=2956795 RepID=UPI00209B75C3|nr:DUF1549 and DUF1553 domain-containing protein [Stieleria tagensis]MCO8124474.1 DUF1549 and DUF1553 domain-containing protein [Stieleria tagensis]